MIDAGIYSDDLLVVDRFIIRWNTAILLLPVLNGEFTSKSSDKSLHVDPYQPIFDGDGDDVEIFKMLLHSVSMKFTWNYVF